MPGEKKSLDRLVRRRVSSRQKAKCGVAGVDLALEVSVVLVNRSHGESLVELLHHAPFIDQQTDDLEPSAIGCLGK